MNNKQSKHSLLLSTPDQQEIYFDQSEELVSSDNQQPDHDGVYEENQSSHEKNYSLKNHNSIEKQTTRRPLQKNTSRASYDSDTNSLSYLTKQFISLIQNTRRSNCLDIAYASQILQVQKRRIYDITNVLQGIGYIQKVGKNQMRWVGGTKDQMQSEILAIDNKIDKYQQRNKTLDLQIDKMNELIKQFGNSPTPTGNYFTKNELIYIFKNMGCSTGIIYKGIQGVQISVSQNPHTGNKQITIQSPQKQAKFGKFYQVSKLLNSETQFTIKELVLQMKTGTLNNDKEQKGVQKKDQIQLICLQNEFQNEKAQSKSEEHIPNEHQQKSSTFQDEQKFSQKKNDKIEIYPLLGCQPKKQKKAMIIKVNLKKKTKQNIQAGKIQKSQSKNISPENNHQNQKQIKIPIPRRKDPKDPDIYFQSDSKQGQKYHN